MSEKLSIYIEQLKLFFKESFNGQRPLWQSWWCLGVLGGGITARVFAAFGSYAMLLATPIYIYIFICIWRCARNVKWRGWGYIAKGLVILYSLLILLVDLDFISNGYVISWLDGES